MLIISLLASLNSNAQSIPTVKEVNDFINDSHLLITYREGEVIYGTYYFIEIHYCPSGKYGLYVKTVKQTVLGNEQQSNSQEFGNWKVIEYNGSVGVYYQPFNSQERFIPVYKLSDGTLTTGEGVTIVKQGKAICTLE
jgi:hypothetical protein